MRDNSTKKVKQWYHQYGRLDLPWRETNDPYRIWVSEIMLQQTQVKTVLNRYYFPFLKKFPTLTHLANASVDEVLKSWEGLGYYTRARNLHKTAQICQDELPKDAQELESLPGIGKSTAHAIACFAYAQALPILDANVKRILYRYFALEKATPKELWDYSYQLFDKNSAYEFNQAMMDIGATICISKNPKCRLCPFEEECQGKGEPHLYPTKKIKKIKPVKTPYIIVYKKNHQYALFQSNKRLLGGLWGFKQSDTKPPKSKEIADIVHHYSHFTLKASVVLVEASCSDCDRWFTLQEIETLALSGVDRKVVGCMDQV